MAASRKPRDGTWLWYTGHSEIVKRDVWIPTRSLEERVEKLEIKIKEVEERLAEQVGKGALNKRGWRWFVGIGANNPHFENAVRFGQEWRYADRPKDEEAGA